MYNREYYSSRLSAERQATQRYFTGYVCQCCGEENHLCLNAWHREQHSIVDLVKDGWTYEDLVRSMPVLTVLCHNCHAKLAATPRGLQLMLALDSMLDAEDDMDLDEPIADSPPEATMHLPGSQEKIDAMRQRFAAGYPVLHNGDAKPCLD